MPKTSQCLAAAVMDQKAAAAVVEAIVTPDQMIQAILITKRTKMKRQLLKDNNQL